MNDSTLEHARELHRRIPLIDGHNDLPWQYRQKVSRALSKIDISKPQPELHTDIPRLREGGVGGQFWSVYVATSLTPEESVRATMEQIDLFTTCFGLTLKRSSLPLPPMRWSRLSRQARWPR